MSNRTLLACAAVLAAGLAAPALGQSSPGMAQGTGTSMPAATQTNSNATTSQALSPAGTGGSNGVAIGTRGAGTGNSFRQPTSNSTSNLSPTTPPSPEGGPPVVHTAPH